MSYEEEDTCMPYEEEDTCIPYEEEDACMPYEEEDTCQVATKIHRYAYGYGSARAYLVCFAFFYLSINITPSLSINITPSLSIGITPRVIPMLM